MRYSTISFPNIFNITTGKTECSKDNKSIYECLYLLITSSVRELLGDPDYGTNLIEYTYEHNNSILNELVSSDIVSKISKYENRVYVDRSMISINNNNNNIEIIVKYYIKDQNKYSDLVIPLSKEEVFI